MRSFCVIPHSARESAFFDAVFEDGVRVWHGHRTLPLPFTHVLSPAHDLSAYISGPLLEAVRAGHQAMIVVALPACEESMGPSSGERPRTGVRGGPRAQAVEPPPPSDPSQPSPHPGGGVLEDGTAVAAELYASLLPRLFHSAPPCTHASVSVVSVSAQDRSVVDELQASGPTENAEATGTRVRSLAEVTWTSVDRAGSASAWGRVLAILTARHTALTSSGASLAAQTACVVTVQLDDGYGRVVLVDAGSDQELLQSLTLILGASRAAPTDMATATTATSSAAAAQPRSGGRTLPPRTPLYALLRQNTTGAATGDVIHVVAVPHPVCEPRNSLRVMRFASDAGCTDPVPPPALASAPAASTERAPRLPTALPPPLPPTPQPHALPCTTAGATTPREAAVDTSSSFAIGGSAVGAGATTREQHLVSRVAALEAELRGLTGRFSAVEGARVRVEAELASVKAALRERQEAWLEAQATSTTLRQELEQHTALAPKLLQRIRLLEKRRDELLAAQTAAAKERRVEESAVRARDETIVALRKQLAVLEQRETQRVRAANLRRLEEKRSTEVDRARDVAEGGAEPRVARVAMEELRRRNRELEAALREARSRPSEPTDPCPSCARLQEQLTYTTRELARARGAQDDLVRALTRKGPPAQGASADPSVLAKGSTQDRIRDADTGGVPAMVASVLVGCASLRVQLAAMAPLVEESGGLVQPAIIAEHARAVAALEDAVREIGCRPCRLVRTGPGPRRAGREEARRLDAAVGEPVVPRMATAADVAALTARLAFEAERAEHLRAFLPTFAQLAVAVEHLSLQLKRVEYRQGRQGRSSRQRAQHKDQWTGVEFAGEGTAAPPVTPAMVQELVRDLRRCAKALRAPLPAAGEAPAHFFSRDLWPAVAAFLDDRAGATGGAVDPSASPTHPTSCTRADAVAPQRVVRLVGLGIGPFSRRESRSSFLQMATLVALRDACVEYVGRSARRTAPDVGKASADRRTDSVAGPSEEGAGNSTCPLPPTVEASFFEPLAIDALHGESCRRLGIGVETANHLGAYTPRGPHELLVLFMPHCPWVLVHNALLANWPVDRPVTATDTNGGTGVRSASGLTAVAGEGQASPPLLLRNVLMIGNDIRNAPPMLHSGSGGSRGGRGPRPWTVYSAALLSVLEVVELCPPWRKGDKTRAGRQARRETAGDYEEDSAGLVGLSRADMVDALLDTAVMSFARGGDAEVWERLVKDGRGKSHAIIRKAPELFDVIEKRP